MRLHLTLGETTVDAELYDNPVAHQVAALLPLERSLRDYGGQEKLAPLGHTLDLSGVPRSGRPVPGEIAYYASGDHLVLYYEDPGSWPGLVPIGRFDLNLDTLRDLPDGTTLRLAPRDTP